MGLKAVGGKTKIIQLAYCTWDRDLWLSFGAIHGKVGVLVTQLCPTLCNPWTVTHKAPPSMGFPRQEQWSGLPFPSPGIVPTQGSNPGLPHSRQTLYHLSLLSFDLLCFFLFLEPIQNDMLPLRVMSPLAPFGFDPFLNVPCF